MLVILGLALLPFGLIAFLSSLATANAGREGRVNEARLVAEAGARRLSVFIDSTVTGLRAAATAAAIADEVEEHCEQTLAALASLEDHVVRLAIFHGDGRLMCATPEFAPIFADPSRNEAGRRAEIDAEMGSARFLISGANGDTIGVAQFPRETLVALVAPDRNLENFEIALHRAGERHVLHAHAGDLLTSRTHRFREPIAESDLELETRFEIAPFSIAEILTIALPILMWLTAALLGWYLVNRLLLRPLGRLQQAVSHHGKDGTPFTAPPETRIASEINALGLAFRHAFETLESNKAELAEGLASQQRLTREVHHRVKNNLQVISSLLNLHARESGSAEATRAYAGIQRRVGALAVVQRNLFAESEAGSGVALRPILVELASGLHRSAPEAARLIIDLDIADIRVSQDIAVPVAFLVTELVEMALQHPERADIRLVLRREKDGAMLSLASDALAAGAGAAPFDRYARVLEGLARQLRHPLENDPENGEYRIVIPISD